MEVPGPRMSLLYGPTHRKCLCGLLESTLMGGKSPVSAVGLLKEERMNRGWRRVWRGSTFVFYSLDWEHERCSYDLLGSRVRDPDKMKTKQSKTPVALNVSLLARVDLKKRSIECTGPVLGLVSFFSSHTTVAWGVAPLDLHVGCH